MSDTPSRSWQFGGHTAPTPGPSSPSPKATKTTKSTKSSKPAAPSTTSALQTEINQLNAQAAASGNDPFNTSINEQWIIQGSDMGHQTVAPAGLAAIKSGDGDPGGVLNRQLIDLQENATVKDLVQHLFQISQPDLKALQQRLVEANYLNSKDSTSGLSNVTGVMDSRTLSAYESLLSDVYRYQQSDPNDSMTVDDMLNKKIAAYQAGGGNTQTQTTVNLFNPLQAQSFLQGAASKLLGRDPNPGEIAGFVSALNAYQQQNPDTSTVTVNADGTKSTQTDKAGITSLHGGDAAAENYLLNDQGGDVGQHSQNVAMQSLLSMLGVGAMPGMSGN